MKKQKNNIWAYALVLFVSAVLRFIALNHTGYWIDEMSSIHFAGHPKWIALFWDNSPVLYHLLLKIQIFLFGNSEIATRSLSGVMSLFITFLWAREGQRIAGTRGVLWLGLLHAVFALSVWYAREARMYALFELAATLTIFAFLRLIEGQPYAKRKTVAAIALLYFSHYLSVMPLFIGLALVFTFIPLKKISRREVMPFYIGLVIAMLSMALIRWESLAWQTKKFVVEPDSRWPFTTIFLLLSGWAGVLALTSTAAVGWRERGWRSQFGLFGVLITFTAATALAFLMQRSVFVPRYFIYCTPFIILSFAASLGPFKNKKRWQSLVINGSFALMITSQFFASVQVILKENPPWREAALKIVQMKTVNHDIQLYTTRPLSMQSPYFDHLPIHKLDIRDPEHFLDPIIEAQTQGYETWIIENYWGLEGYDQLLSLPYKGINCTFEDFSVDNPNTESIRLLRVWCPVFDPNAKDGRGVINI